MSRNEHAALMKMLIERICIVKDEAALEALLQSMRPASLQRPLRLAFVNAHAFNLCYHNPAFLSDLLQCDYILRDGSGMKILYRLLGRDPGMNLNGTDFIPRLFPLYQGEEAALLGTAAPYLDKAAAKITTFGVTPSVMVDGFQPDTAYVNALAKKSAPLVILAMGMPKQERVATQLAQATSGPCLIVCGGAILDFLGGKVRRAPKFFQALGIEWLFRLAQEPRRLFKRYVIGNAVFMMRAAALAKG